jgi:hypothetical protein
MKYVMEKNHEYIYICIYIYKLCIKYSLLVNNYTYGDDSKFWLMSYKFKTDKSFTLTVKFYKLLLLNYRLTLLKWNINSVRFTGLEVWNRKKWESWLLICKSTISCEFLRTAFDFILKQLLHEIDCSSCFNVNSKTLLKNSQEIVELQPLPHTSSWRNA